jgi:hypothetical protein
LPAWVPSAHAPGPGADSLAWRDWHQERAAIREFEAGYPRPIAERLGFNEYIDRWRRPHWSTPADTACCAGCDKPLSVREALLLPDGVRIHLDHEYRCLIACGRRWRGAAVKGLAGLGIVPPASWEL